MTGRVLSQSRSTKVFAAVLISIIIGAVILKTFGNNPPSAGAFSLTDYYCLMPIEEVISSDFSQTNYLWDSIEVIYSNTDSTEIDSKPFLVDYDVLECHFIVWNGLIGGDGQVQPTEKWRKQEAMAHDLSFRGSDRVIRICVIADNKTFLPTDFQIKRTEVLVKALQRKFDIQSPSVYCPVNLW